jgi:hypothetical protein
MGGVGMGMFDLDPSLSTYINTSLAFSKKTIQIFNECFESKN